MSPKAKAIWFLYSVLWYVLLPLVMLRLAYRSRKAPAYGERVAERFGLFRYDSSKEAIWVHSVSVGETLAAAPLVKQLLKKYPECQVVVTTMTPTGSERVKALFGDSVFHVYAPYDFPIAVKRFYKKIRPKMAIIMETELWPNTLKIADQQHIPVVLANARLSERSAAGYKKVGFVSEEMLKCLTLIAAQNEPDAERFRSLGVSDQQLYVTGSIKFDVQIPDGLSEQAFQLRKCLGNDRDIFIAASTHEGEESQLLDLYQQLKRVLPELLLVIVPRHPERFRSVEQLIVRRGLSVARRSKGEACSDSTDVYLGDTMGEMMLMYQASDVVFMGGSLVEHGGHNPMEPAALGKPILTGTHTFNFDEIMKRMIESGSVKQIKNSIELMSEVQQLFTDGDLYQRMSKASIDVVKKNQGALSYLLELIDNELKR
ncbi:lipid IV(A) 3-deoxy-D-manno-octulosonic acid transferase [Litoribrevibacter albus]|uniref:3-deoxy-D-manno-octulosonic acid transferase n=1 Tax=Litoribrevibacter albus TaxID=1473156 RepID=A0AA37SAT1_9GAMM|nr:lipid IV(A) 3-deoxy-D-manno-octulosonic acid transferase [Litoribrevibacter albus]GLQ32497.1 3-deoxy-D-manno-octulosonic acid transferase [Litoribrevibacter albus]